MFIDGFATGRIQRWGWFPIIALEIGHSDNRMRGQIPSTIQGDRTILFRE